VAPAQLSHSVATIAAIGKSLGKLHHAAQVFGLKAAAEFTGQAFAEAVHQLGAVLGALAAQHFAGQTLADAPVKQGQFGVDRRCQTLPAGGDEVAQFVVQGFQRQCRGRSLSAHAWTPFGTFVVGQDVIQGQIGVFAEFVEQCAQFGDGGIQFAQGEPGDQGGFVALGLGGFGVVVLEPADVQVVAAGGDLLAGEAAPAAVSPVSTRRGQGGGAALRVVAEDVLELVARNLGGRIRLGAEVVAAERRALAELGHVGAHVVDPHFLGVALVGLATGEEQHIGLDALGVEDAGGQAQDGVQVALVHQVAANVGADVAFEEHVVGQHHGGAATGLEAAVDVLQEANCLLLVG
jgi:hypothetical protein